MAGGIFVDQPYHPNPKCLLFSLVAIMFYWFSPAKKNALLIPVIFVISYVAMAWYDYMYNCDLIMYSGKALGANTLDAIFKPQRRHEKHPNKNLSKNQEQEYLSRVYWFHVIAVAPLLIYVGYMGQKSPKKVFPVVLWLGIIALVYHGFRAFYPRDTHSASESKRAT
jgi:hypothetical protein